MGRFNFMIGKKIRRFLILFCSEKIECIEKEMFSVVVNKIMYNILTITVADAFFSFGIPNCITYI